MLSRKIGSAAWDFPDFEELRTVLGIDCCGYLEGKKLPINQQQAQTFIADVNINDVKIDPINELTYSMFSGDVDYLRISCFNQHSGTADCDFIFNFITNVNEKIKQRRKG